MEKFCLNPNFSTTRQLYKGDHFINPQENKLEGGLRKAGYYKATDNSNPLISIITVTYNAGSYLEKTILSVLQLEYLNIEYIIIDGGSKDATLGLLQKYDSAIDYWVSEPDKGIYDAMNKGWKSANKDAFILYLGSGDAIRSLPSDMKIYGKDEIIYGQVILNSNTVFASFVDNRLRFRNTLHHQALLINKSIHPQPPFDINYKINGDFDFNQRLFKMGYKFVKAENFLSDTLPHGISSTISFEKFKIVKKNYGLFSALLTLIFDLFFIPTRIIYPVIKTIKT